MDSFITFIIVLVISGIAALLKKKGQSEGGPTPPPPIRPGQPRPLSAPRPQATSWEDELRRLLEGEQPAPPRPMRPPAPVVVAPPSVPAPVPFNRPLSPAPQPRPQFPAAPKPRVAPIPVPMVPTLAPIEISAAQLSSLSESREAYERASRIDQTMSAHINRVAGEHVGTTVVVRRQASPEAVQVLALFKNARSARQAFLASIIFGPPPALEQNSTLF